MTRLNYSFDILALKNLVAAPMFEEFIYRVCLINFCIESGMLSQINAVYIMPIFFAVSHLHHAISERKTMQTKKRKLLLFTLLRLSYTQIFGIYSGLVYIKTGSIWPAVALHSQCNFFGFPSFNKLFDQECKLTDRIFATAFYVLGVVFVLTSFNSFFDDY